MRRGGARHSACLMEQDCIVNEPEIGVPDSSSRSVVRALILGWALVYATAITAFALSISVGSEMRFCDAFERPMHDAGPFGQYASDYEWLASAKADWVGGLFVLELIGSVVMVTVCWRLTAIRGTALVTIVFASAVGVVSTFGLMVNQIDDGAFCTGASRVVGFAVLAGLIALDGFALSKFRRAGRRPAA